MTEDEAKTKWCPHAVASHTDPRGTTGYARPDLGLPADTFHHACIASACMAWRPSTPPKTRQESCGPQGGYRTVVIANGYCGLAGAPA